MMIGDLTTAQSIYLILVIGILIVEMIRVLSLEKRNRLFGDQLSKTKRLENYKYAQVTQEIRKWATDFSKANQEYVNDTLKAVDYTLKEVRKDLDTIAHDSQQIKSGDDVSMAREHLIINALEKMSKKLGSYKPEDFSIRRFQKKS